VKDDERKALIEQAKAMQEQANALLEAAGAADTDKTEDPADLRDSDEPSGASSEGDEEEAGTSDELGVVTSGLPVEEESVEAKIDPPEKMDMAEELEAVRNLIRNRGFQRKAAIADAEVWERPGPQGTQGFLATFVTTPHGRIRLELRDPRGMIVTQVEPATLIDSEIMLNTRIP